MSRLKLDFFHYKHRILIFLKSRSYWIVKPNFISKYSCDNIDLEFFITVIKIRTPKTLFSNSDIEYENIMNIY